MFNQLVHQFEGTVRKLRSVTARLYVNGLATRVIATYRPQQSLELRGFPVEVPPYLLFEQDNVYLTPHKTARVEDEEEAAFYGLYRTWDPRVFISIPLKEETQLVGGRWTATYELKHLCDQLGLSSKHLQGIIKRFPEQRITFLVERDRLRELTERDLSDYPTYLTLAFEYRDEYIAPPTFANIQEVKRWLKPQ